MGQRKNTVQADGVSEKGTKQLLTGRAIRVLFLLVATLCRAADPTAAYVDDPILSWDKGIASDSPLLRPGKLDFLYRYQPDQCQYNFFGWSPVFKGGGGVIDNDALGTTRYAGGFLRPLVLWPDKGDLILGAHGLETPTSSAAEFQGEFRLPMGLGFGGGFVDASKGGYDVAFGKATFRRKWGGWNYILEAQAQEYGRKTSPGGYGAIYNQQIMGVLGTDGEQWRATVGYIAPWTNAFVRPTFEVLYVDNTIGEVPGNKQWFANATLNYQGGFLSHPARLGRAMGPQGLEFGNPLGFLVPMWNRRLETWEMGSLMDLRAEHITRPNGAIQERYEGVLFPFQFANTKTVLDNIFVGASYFKSPTKDTPGVIAGIIGKVGFLKVGVGVEHQFRHDETMVVVGLVDAF